MANEKSRRKPPHPDEFQETIKGTTVILPLARERTWLDFMDNDSMKFFPQSEEYRKRVIFTMYQWADREESVELQQFSQEYKIPRSTLYEWQKIDPAFKNAVTEVMLILASRRRRGALFKKMDASVVFKDIHKYDAEWLEINKYHADLRKEEQVQSGIKWVEIPAQRVTGRVKPLQVQEAKDEPIEGEANNPDETLGR